MFGNWLWCTPGFCHGSVPFCLLCLALANVRVCSCALCHVCFVGTTHCFCHWHCPCCHHCPCHYYRCPIGALTMALVDCCPHCCCHCCCSWQQKPPQASSCLGFVIACGGKSFFERHCGVASHVVVVVLIVIVNSFNTCQGHVTLEVAQLKLDGCCSSLACWRLLFEAVRNLDFVLVFFFSSLLWCGLSCHSDCMFCLSADLFLSASVCACCSTF